MSPRRKGKRDRSRWKRGLAHHLEASRRTEWLAKDGDARHSDDARYLAANNHELKVLLKVQEGVSYVEQLGSPQVGHDELAPAPPRTRHKLITDAFCRRSRMEEPR